MAELKRSPTTSNAPADGISESRLSVLDRRAAYPQATSTMPSDKAQENRAIIVKEGETLTAISKRLKISLKEIIRANPEIDPDRIQVGMRINLPDNLPHAATERPKAITVVEGGLGPQFRAIDERLRNSDNLKTVESASWLAIDATSKEVLAAVDADMQHPVASMIKPFVALAFAHEVWKGRQEWSADNVTLLTAMLQKSDNKATNTIIEMLGGAQRANQILHANYPELTKNTLIKQSIPEDGREYENLSSARDCARLLLAMHERKLPGSENLLEIMAMEQTDRIVDGTNGEIPANTPVSRKGGATARFIGDMGIVSYSSPDGTSKPIVFIGMISRTERALDYYQGFGNRADAIIREKSVVLHHALKQSGAIR